MKPALSAGDSLAEYSTPCDLLTQSGVYLG